MNSITRYNALPVSPSIELILHRLGYKRASGPAPSEITDAIHRYIDSFQVHGAYTTIPIDSINEGAIRLKNGLVFCSNGLAKLVNTSQSLAFMASSVKNAASITRQLFNAKNADQAIIADATAAQCADYGLTTIMNIQKTTLRRSGQKLTEKRFSAGYSDLELSYQKIIFDVLKLNEMSLSIDETSYMLSPEKSVLAIAGVQSIG